MDALLPHLLFILTLGCPAVKLHIHIRKQTHSIIIILIILNNESLQHLRRTRKEIPVRQTLKHLRADICKLRLIDHPEHILITVEIHTGLAADSSIDLSEKSRRHISETHSPLINRSSKTNHIRRNATAHSQHQRIPSGTFIQQPAADIHHRPHSLGTLIRVNQHTRRALLIKSLRNSRCRRAIIRHLCIHHSIHLIISGQLRSKRLQTILHKDTADHLLI